MSSGNGGGKGFFDNTFNLDSFSGEGNFFENLTHDVLNVGIQGMTGGILGYENGKLSNGVTTNGLKKSGKETVSGLKEVTGAKAAEDANDMARKQFEQTKADAEQARLDSQAQIAASEMQKSKIAGAARNATASRSANKGAAIGSYSLGSDEKDFLGL
jgi:hypothetical protein